MRCAAMLVGMLPKQSLWWNFNMLTEAVLHQLHLLPMRKWSGMENTEVGREN